MTQELLSLPVLPSFPNGSPQIVLVLDRIRKTLDDERHGEFYWFAREYPRIYRYHISHAELRLASIYEQYQKAVRYFESQLQKVDENAFELAIGDHKAYRIYWDFETFLGAISTALDVLARVIGTAYEQQTPPSFNKLCSRTTDGPADLLRAAKTLWVERLKDYRDCFVHYTPVETINFITCGQYNDGWEVRCKLPTNPNVRNVLEFRFNRRTEVLRYSIAVYRHLLALDRKMAKHILRLFRGGEFPKRIDHIFSLGSRRR